MVHNMCAPCSKAKFLLLGPKCLVGEAKPRPNTRNLQLVLQGPFGTAEGRETMTTTPETSLEVNYGPCTVIYAKPKVQFGRARLMASLSPGLLRIKCHTKGRRGVEL